MNLIFGIVITVSTATMLVLSPDSTLKSMLDGAESGLDLTLKLTVVYAVWLGVFALLEKTKLDEKFAKLLRPINKRLFGKIPDKANDFMALNISANVLGMSGATTPMGIKSIQELEKHPNTNYAISMFFVINATSIQIIPSSILALRTSMNSANAGNVILPTILATALSTIIGVLLVKIFIKKDV